MKKSHNLHYMNIILLQSHLSDEEIRLLIKEFPQYLFLSPTELEYRNFDASIWGKIEIIYGHKLGLEQLLQANQLRWIHSSIPSLSSFCLNDIEKADNIIVTRTKEENVNQIAEYVMAGVLTFAKNLIQWHALKATRDGLWDSRLRETMWTLNEKIFLQIGLSGVGTEIARRASLFDMRVFGVQEHSSFHPYCKKIFTFQELSQVLPLADIVSIALPRNEQKRVLLGKQELELMKTGTILAIIGSKMLLNEKALEDLGCEKFRGIILDAFYELPISHESKLWDFPNIILTPEVAPRPRLSNKESFRLFRYNLRQFLHNNFSEMKNIMNLSHNF